jgi:voltage-gated potassium channel
VPVDQPAPAAVTRRPTDKSARKLLIAVLFLVGTFLVGTVGYVLIEGWSVGDAVYMTVISVTTTGFAEVRELTQGGRVLTMLVIVGGIVSLAYVGGRAVQLAVEVYLHRRGRMNRRIAKLRNHVILCGYGRMGRHIAADLDQARIPFVVIEREPDNTSAMEEQGYNYLVGDASSDALLLQAGVESARGLIAVVTTDAENVYITLTARALNQSLSIVARALSDESESKLRTAGADRVIKPYELVGRRIAQLVIRPTMVEFIDTVARSRAAEITMEEITVAAGSTLSGIRLGETTIRKDLNVIVVAIRRSGEELLYNPGPDTTLHDGDRLIAIGKKEQLIKLGALCGVLEEGA